MALLMTTGLVVIWWGGVVVLVAGGGGVHPAGGWGGWAGSGALGWAVGRWSAFQAARLVGGRLEVRVDRWRGGWVLAWSVGGGPGRGAGWPADRGAGRLSTGPAVWWLAGRVRGGPCLAQAGFLGGGRGGGVEGSSWGVAGIISLGKRSGCSVSRLNSWKWTCPILGHFIK